ncbi:HAD-IA family hydrolase [Halothiobacillus sp.]|uniref:HAD-IA family hydrolase n=1 Tax=Halothiobacillus sp. TaxID=1891311 RepID=UPI00260D19B7|nr:HAD-IA family hydrolase [Halothiobacillus sp.]
MRFDAKLPSNQTQPIQGVLFDLDGTLIDTAPDMALALNRLRLECNLPPLPFDQIRPQVSNGARGLLEIGFQLGPDDQGFVILRDRFLQLYQQDIAGETRLFSGFDEVIDWLNQQEMNWGIVTNKPGFLTRQLLKALDIQPLVVIAGDDLLRRKPFPDQLIYAAGHLRLPPQRIMYVGDHERDIQASRAAHMPSAAVRWGYLDGERPIEDWLADVILTTPTDLLALLSPTSNPH